MHGREAGVQGMKAEVPIINNFSTDFYVTHISCKIAVSMKQCQEILHLCMYEVERSHTLYNPSLNQVGCSM